MTGSAPVPRLLRLSMTLAALGALVSLALFLRAGPYTLVAFMFLAQPLLGLAVVLFAVQVFHDLRREGLL
jgi:cation transporter-like permease